MLLISFFYLSVFDKTKLNKEGIFFCTEKKFKSAMCSLVVYKLLIAQSAIIGEQVCSHKHIAKCSFS